MPAALACPAFLLALGIAACAAPPPALAPAIDPYASLAGGAAQADPRAARDIISIYRHNNGLPVLTIDPVLQAAAQAKANEMARTGQAKGDVVLKEPRGIAVSNVSAGYHSVAEAFSGWRQSALHNAHMLSPGVTRIGLATAYAPGSKYKVFWALVLAD